MRLTASFWTAAVIRRAQSAGAFAALRRKGAQGTSVVLVKVSTLDGRAFVLSPVTGLSGERVFMRATGPAAVEDAEAEAYLARALARDPDIWALEIEDREGRWFFDEAVV